MPLLVDVHPPTGSEPTHIELLLDACSQAAPLACVRTDPDAPESRDAVVKWQDDYDQVAVWLYVEDRLLYRTVVFSPADQAADRIMAAGLLLGSLVRESQEQEAPQEETTPQAKPEPAIETADKEPVPKSLGFIQPSFGVGQGAALRVGGRMDVGVNLLTPLSVYGFIGIGLEPTKTEEIRFQMLEGGGGLAVASQIDPLFWEVGVGFVFQEITGRMTLEGESETQKTQRPGGEIFLGLGVLVSPWLAVVARGRAGMFPETPRIHIEDSERLRLRPVEASGNLGLRLTF